MASVNLDQVLTEFDGTTPLVDETQKGEGPVPVVLNKVCFRALVSTYADERNVTGEDKYKRGKLAERVYNGGVVDLEAKEIELIKELVGKAYSPIIVGQAWDMLEGRISPPEEPKDPKPEEEPVLI